MLALALAESAQQASAQSHKRPGDAHAESTNYGEAEAGTALEKLHLSAGAPDKLHLFTALPENRLHFQPGAPLEQDCQGTAGEQNHPPGAPGGQEPPPLHAGVPGDTPGSRDAEQEQCSFHPGRAGDKEPFPAHGGDWEPAAPQGPGALPEREPPAAELAVEQPHLRTGLPGDKLHAPCTAEDKLQSPSVAPAGDKGAPYLSTLPSTAAEPHAPPGAAPPADVTVPPAPRAATAPAQRQEHQAAVGQVPAAKAPSGSGQVWSTAAPEKPPEPVPGFVSESSSSTRGSSSVPAGHQSQLEKPRESTRAPPLHLRSESVPAPSSYSFTPPVPPVRTLESKIAAAMHSNNTDTINNSNYHSFLASSMLASSVEEALLPPPPPPKHASLQPVYVPHPKPESLPEPVGPDGYLHAKHQYRPESVPAHSYHGKAEQHQPYPPRPEPPVAAGARYGSYGTQGKGSATGLHPKPRGRTDFVSSVSPTGLRGAGYAEEAPPYPTIRRVQSLHVPSPAAAAAIRSVPISRTEVPPDDEPVYCPRPLYQYKPYQPHSDYHVTQLQPYFENGRVHYRYSPYSSSSSSPYYTAADGSFYDLDPYSTVRVRPFHGLPGREFGPYASRLQGKGLYRYPSLAAYPRAGLINHLGKEHSFVSRDVPPAPDIKHMYMSWDLEDMEKYRMQSIRRESRTRQKVKGPLMSQYDNVAPLLPDELGGLDAVHLRSKSDPGKSGLLTVAEGKEGRYPAKAATPEGDERYYGQHAEPELDRAHYHGGGYGNGQPEKPSLPQKQSSIRNRKMHEPGGSSSEHRTHLQQEASHRQPSEPKNGPPYSEYRPKGGPEPSEPMGYQHSGSKYIPAGQETLRLNHKEGRLAEDRPDLERPRGRASMEKHSRDCYKEEEHAAPSVAPPPKPERSHSLRMQHPEPMERDSALLYPYQTLGKRQSTMTVVSQYDNLEDYHTLPQHQRGGYAGAGGFVPPGFPHVHSRTYATALGQGAFLPTELCLQRPETEVHVE